MEEKELSEQESLQLITSMINKAKNSYHETGIGAIMWGIVITVCSLEKLAETYFNYTLPVDIFWLTFIAIIPQIWFSSQEKKQRQARSHNDIVMDYMWLAFGICIFLLVFIDNGVYSDVSKFRADYRAIANESHSFLFSDHALGYFLLLYGFPTFVTGAIMNFKPMLLGGIICWVCCVISVFFNMQIDLLLTAVSAMAAWLIPGIILRKKYLRYRQMNKGEDV